LRIILLSWEFPPRNVGELAHYVNKLAIELVKKELDVYVITYHDFALSYNEGVDGIKAYRVPNPIKNQISVLSWDLTLNQEFERVAANIYYSTEHQIDLIDVHDWHYVPAAVTLKKAFNTPFIFSIHSLEDHRAHGANAPFNLAIKSIEWLGAYESERIIVKSDWMKDEVERIYKVPPEKIEAVNPDSSKWIDSIIVAYRSCLPRVKIE